MRDKEISVHTWLSGFDYRLSGSGVHQYKTFYRNENNEDLFTQLYLDGFFDFHTSNGGSIVSYHQIVAFYCCGGREALANGITCVQGHHEVHHLDGDSLNNDGDNLIYVPTLIHYLLTHAQRRILKLFKHFRKLGRGQVMNLLVWNKNGKVVSRVLDWLRVVLTKTVIKTAATYGVTIHIKELWRFARGVVGRCKLGLDKALLVRSYFLMDGTTTYTSVVTL